MHCQAMEGREKILRAKHKDTLESIYQVGWALYKQEKYVDIEEMHC